MLGCLICHATWVVSTCQEVASLTKFAKVSRDEILCDRLHVFSQMSKLNIFYRSLIIYHSTTTSSTTTHHHDGPVGSLRYAAGLRNRAVSHQVPCHDIHNCIPLQLAGRTKYHALHSTSITLSASCNHSQTMQCPTSPSSSSTAALAWGLDQRPTGGRKHRGTHTWKWNKN